jgi:Zn-dependent peptidase ImmA (M78 family)
MGTDYRWGFKTQAERLALEVRASMGLDWQERLDPRALAKHVGVAVFDLPEMRRLGMKEQSLRFLLGRGRREFSAALFECNGVRVIVANTAHSEGRQASNIVHEVGHLLLRHNPPTEVIEIGCRRWDARMELEADWLAGELLVPRQAAVEVARRQIDADIAAQQFGVSRALMEWRLNHSGARRQIDRERLAHERRQSESRARSRMQGL